MEAKQIIDSTGKIAQLCITDPQQPFEYRINKTGIIRVPKDSSAIGIIRPLPMRFWPRLIELIHSHVMTPEKQRLLIIVAQCNLLTINWSS